MSLRSLPVIVALLASLSFCNLHVDSSQLATRPRYKTQNVVVIIMDGARYSESWGDSTHQWIPRIANDIAPVAVVNTAFYNDGPTYTLAGHAAITTGFYAEINNSGLENPRHPSYFQYFARHTAATNQNWLVTSKDKLSVLADCQDPAWSHQFTPSYNCGTDGSGTGCGYRDDSLTMVTALDVLAKHHPKLMLINFLEPDGAGHSGVWDDYTASIKKTDQYIYTIWKYLQTDKTYKSNTTVIITNDHGRHSDGIESGFSNHGCPCDGCRHLFFVATGPDFKKSSLINQHYDLVDIPATIAELLGFSMNCEGEVMREIFK